MDKKEARDLIKERSAQRKRPKKRGRKKKSRYEGKDWDLYDRLTKEEQNKFWDSENGTLKFKEITGEKYYPQFIVDRAFELFVDGLTIEEISIKWNIPPETVSYWSQNQDWVEKIERINRTVEAKYHAHKVKDALTERKDIDDRHLNVNREMQARTLHTVRLSDVIKTEMDPQRRRQMEQSQLNQIKVLKIATDCFNALINQERMIVGIKDVEIETELPTNFTFTIEVGDHAIGDAGLESLLPSQDPHEFIPDDMSSESNQIDSPKEQGQIIVNIPQESLKPSDAPLDPITIARDNALLPVRHEPQPPKKQVHPAFGYLDMGPGF